MKNYNKYIVFFSGGKDSTACVLHLLDIGIPKDKIELWHHDVDGKGRTFMDWEITPAYCKAFAEALGLKIYFSWKNGGFEKEMLRNNSRTAPTSFETPDGLMQIGGDKGKESTRLKFPQTSPDLSVRWCSAYLKIDVGASALRNQKRFNNTRTLTISGERAEEALTPKNFKLYLSNELPDDKIKGRASYKTLEVDRSDLRNGKKFTRHVDRWRPIKDWKESEVWDIIKRYNIRVHPAYYLGFGRLSCKYCIFGNADQFKTAYKISPDQGNLLINYEKSFGYTIKSDKGKQIDLKSLMKSGISYDGIENKNLVNVATSFEYNLDVIMKDWYLPSGAYGKSSGPV